MLKQAIPYIRMYKGKTFVVKVGGRVVGRKEMLDALVEDVCLLQQVGIRVVLVHGGGSQATDLSKRLGLEPKLVTAGASPTPRPRDREDGLRRQPQRRHPRDLPRHETPAVGVSGIDAGLSSPKKRPVGAVDYGFVGDIESVDPKVLTTLLDAGMTPVVACSEPTPRAACSTSTRIGRRGDRARAQGRKARRGHRHRGHPAGRRQPRQPRLLRRHRGGRGDEVSGRLTGGMLPKVAACIRALQGGVRRTHIINGLKPGALLRENFTNARLRHDDRAEARAPGIPGCRTCSGARRGMNKRRPPAGGHSNSVRVPERGCRRGAPRVGHARTRLVAEGGRAQPHRHARRRRRPLLLLNSHTDNRSRRRGLDARSLAANIEDGKIYGRGSNDAKGLPRRDDPRRAESVRVECSERKSSLGGVMRGRSSRARLGEAASDLPKPDAAVVGEPTGLNSATAQKGLLLLEITATDKGGSCAHGGGVNAVEAAARDVIALSRLAMDKEHPALGKNNDTCHPRSPAATAQVIPTLQIGRRHSTNSLRLSDEIIALVKQTVKATYSSLHRLGSVETDPSHAIIQPRSPPIRPARLRSPPCPLGVPQGHPHGEGGPATPSARTPRRVLEVAELEAGVLFYEKLIRNYFAKAAA